MTLDPELDWVEGAPRSRRFDDVYFAAGDGLAESRAVFLQGCGLPAAWRGRARFTVAELGFGTGLNIAALLELWGRTREPGARLSMFSVEAHPLTRDAAARALAGFPQIARAAAGLLAMWPDGRRGFHRLDLRAFDATLDLYVGEVEAALSAWSGAADAWFLDGFAPACNPAMWSEPVLAAVGRLSAAGAAAATFTVAGAVRRGLAAAGFEVAKRPGYGAKRERLEARRPGPAGARRPSASRVVVVGGGIAGAALVRALTEAGAGCVLVEAEQPGAGASEILPPWSRRGWTPGLGPAAVLHAQAFARALDLYRRDTPEAMIAHGALQLPVAPRDATRFVRVAAWDGFAPGALADLSPADWAVRLDEPFDPAQGGALRFVGGLTIQPAAVLARWLRPATRAQGWVAKVVERDGSWLCLDAGAALAEGDAVCVAAGPPSGALAGLSPLRPVRGQLEYTTASVFTGEAAAWGAYAIPLPGGARSLGPAMGVAMRPPPGGPERAANLQALGRRRPRLAARVAALPPEALRSRVAVRAATADHLPLAGEVRCGLAVLAGLGGRGFTLAPLLAEHVVARLLGAPSPIPVDLAARLDPRRFERENPWVPPSVMA